MVMDTKPIDRIKFLELENLSLKLQIRKKNYDEALTFFQTQAIKTLTDAGLSPDEWGLDLDHGTFVKKDPSMK